MRKTTSKNTNIYYEQYLYKILQYDILLLIIKIKRSVCIERNNMKNNLEEILRLYDEIFEKKTKKNSISV